MKQTAVEWLIEKISTSKYFYNIMEELESRSTIVQANGILQKAMEMEKEQIKEAFYSGYEDRDKFKHSDDYYDKIYERNDWQGILFLGEVDGVKIYYDSYHPDQTLTVELNEDKTEMVYIISPYDDIAVFDGIKKNIIVSEKTTKMIDTKYE
jgi:hypothetical protein